MKRQVGNAGRQLGDTATDGASKGWHSRGYLPHLDAPGTLQAITFRLADSLPQEKLRELVQEVESLPEKRRNAARRRAIDAWLGGYRLLRATAPGGGRTGRADPAEVRREPLPVTGLVRDAESCACAHRSVDSALAYCAVVEVVYGACGIGPQCRAGARRSRQAVLDA
ncbi:hypothetical protein [Nitrococcus mobilis]|uniref:hypothetical protein n=1 Tax=Nitrococcus mobilis TaxID=35797 RepID=UPI000325953D|nr:hypothetical protein [Nitrococcus mobilis]